MKASICLKKFLGRWVNIVLKNGHKMTVKICEIINNMGISTVKCSCCGTRECKMIPRSEIVEVYA